MWSKLLQTNIYVLSCNSFIFSVYSILIIHYHIPMSICRTSDERAYLSGAMSETGMRLAQESILMQYGYNISQLSWFFYKPKETSIQILKSHKKWEDDREFIENYNTGNYAKYGIHGISFRKWICDSFQHDHSMPKTGCNHSVDVNNE